MDGTSWPQAWIFPSKLCETVYRRFVVDHVKLSANNFYMVKVIPLKLFYYQTFFETWHNEHS